MADHLDTEKLTAEFQKQIKNSELYPEIVKQFGAARAEELLKECKANVVASGNMQIPIKIGRNDPCPCGSGKKYKKCCLDKKDKS